MTVRHTFTLPASVAASDSVAKRMYNPDGTISQAAVVITAIGTGTYQVQISIDGTNWTNEGSALTADGRVEITKLCSHVRVDVTAYTSGTPVGVALIVT